MLWNKQIAINKSGKGNFIAIIDRDKYINKAWWCQTYIGGRVLSELVTAIAKEEQHQRAISDEKVFLTKNLFFILHWTHGYELCRVRFSYTMILWNIFLLKLEAHLTVCNKSRNEPRKIKTNLPIKKKPVFQMVSIWLECWSYICWL